MPRPLTVPALLVAGALALSACSLDEAELVSAGAEQVTADVDELRVLRRRDDPARDRWIDVVAPDPEVFDEGVPFREEDSRTADDDEVADSRRLFTAVGDGRTLLVEMNCTTCTDDVPRPGSDLELVVWDMVVGDGGPTFSPGTDLARPDDPTAIAAGDLVVLATPAEGAVEPVLRTSGGRPAPLSLVATHRPDDGADVFVEVYVATEPGDAVVLHRLPSGDTTTYEITVT